MILVLLKKKTLLRVNIINLLMLSHFYYFIVT